MRARGAGRHRKKKKQLNKEKTKIEKNGIKD